MGSEDKIRKFFLLQCLIRYVIVIFNCAKWIKNIQSLYTGHENAENRNRVFRSAAQGQKTDYKENDNGKNCDCDRQQQRNYEESG